MSRAVTAVTIAWVITAVYYFYQYTLRSAPAVMLPELSMAFGMSATAVASMAGLFYYGYSPFSLVAGVAMDRVGPRKVIPIGAGVSVREEVRRAHEIIKASGLEVQLHAYGTNVEGEIDLILDTLKQVHQTLHAEGVVRISSFLKLGTRTDKEPSLAGKLF